MSDAIDQAASAFESAMSGNSSASSKSDADSSNVVLFGNLGELDADSPARGGGDNEEISRKARKPVQKEEESDEEEYDLEADAEAEDEEQPDGEEEREEGEDADDEEDGDSEEGDDDVYEVIVDGERTEVSLREALDGYVRTETFHRRLNWLNEVKDTLRSEAAKVVEDRQKYASLVTRMQSQLDSLVPREPDWAEEYTRDPVAAKQLQLQYEEFKKQRKQLDEESERVAREQREEDERNMAEYTRVENAKILRNHPSWKDAKVMERDMLAMAEVAEKSGFSREEIANTRDSRMINILYKAMKYDKLQASKPKPVRRGNKPSKPGVGSKSTTPKAVGKAQQRLSRTGSVDDAASVFTQLLRKK